MVSLLEIPEETAQRTADERTKTQRSLKAGRPANAATAQQREARVKYLRRHWSNLYDADEITREGHVDDDDTLPSNFLARGARCAKAVARVVWKDRPDEDKWQGTAFLISDWLAVTNNHVLESKELAELCSLEFLYEYDEKGKERNPKVLDLDPERLFITEPHTSESDFAVVAVKPHGPKPPGQTFGFLPLIAERGKIKPPDEVNLIHHPQGKRKRLSIRASRVLAMPDHTFEHSSLRHTGDTLGGSSGAPVFNDQWEVVGLHFGGKPQRNLNGQALTVAGDPWQAGMSESAKAYEFNVAMRTSYLTRRLDDLAAIEATDGGKNLVYEALRRN